MLKKRQFIFMLIVGLLTTGCLIERLLIFKNQLKNPIDYLDFDTPGLLRFHSPILQLEDIALLTGVLPTSMDGNQVKYDFIRPEEPNYSFTYKLVFKNKRLVIIDYPNSFYMAIKSVFAFESLALLGQAEIPTNKIWSVKNKGGQLNAVPTKGEILKIFGPPTVQSNFSDSDILHYHYQHPTTEALQKIKVSLTFDNKSDLMTELFLQLPDRKWAISF